MVLILYPRWVRLPPQFLLWKLALRVHFNSNWWVSLVGILDSERIPMFGFLLLTPPGKEWDLRTDLVGRIDRSMIEKVLICLFSTIQDARKREFGCIFVTSGKSSWFRQRNIQGSRCSQPALSGSCPALTSARSAPGPTILSWYPSTWDCRAQEVSQECCLPAWGWCSGGLLIGLHTLFSHRIARPLLLCLKSSLVVGTTGLFCFLPVGRMTEEVDNSWWGEMGLVLIIYINQLMTFHFLSNSDIDNSCHAVDKEIIWEIHCSCSFFSTELILMFLVSWPSYSSDITRTNRVTLLL